MKDEGIIACWPPSSLVNDWYGGPIDGLLDYGNDDGDGDGDEYEDGDEFDEIENDDDPG